MWGQIIVSLIVAIVEKLPEIILAYKNKAKDVISRFL